MRLVSVHLPLPWAQVLLAIDNLVTGRDLAGLPEAQRRRLVDVTDDVFIRPSHSKEATLALNLMQGIRQMGEDIAAPPPPRHSRDNVKYVRAVADRQTVCGLLHASLRTCLHVDWGVWGVGMRIERECPPPSPCSRAPSGLVVGAPVA
jgi:hypothetical protein